MMNKLGKWKAIPAVLVIAALLLFVQGTVGESANTKTYDEITKMVTVKDPQDNTVAEITLLTPHTVYVVAGYRKIAEFEIDNFGARARPIEGMEVYDMNDGNKQMNRQIDFKYWVKTGEKKIPKYENKCVSNNIGNGTTQECGFIYVGDNVDDVGEWRDFDNSAELPAAKIKIGLFANVKRGEKFEWMPTLFGVRVPEWAVVEEGVWKGIQLYYSFNESAGTAIPDATTKNVNGTGINTDADDWVEGKIGNALKFSGSPEYADANVDISGSGGNTISVAGWLFFNNSAHPSGSSVIGDNVGGVDKGWSLGLGAATDSNNLSWRSANMWYGTGTGGAEMFDNKWIHVAAVVDAGTLTYYVNGTAISSLNVISWSADGHVLFAKQDGGNYMTGYMDEWGIWNRSLTQDEISELYNDGDGLTFGEHPNNAPNITIALDKTDVYTDTWVEVSGNYTDLDNDLGTMYFDLTVNGSHKASHNVTDVANGTSVSWTVDPANWSWKDNVTFKITAYDGKASDIKTINRTINNSAPSISGIPDQNTDEDTAPPSHWIDLRAYAEDIDEADNLLTFAVDSETNTTLINCFIADSYYFECGTPAENAVGTSEIVVSVNDTGGLSDTDTFTVTVDAVNDAPNIISFDSSNASRNYPNESNVYFTEGDNITFTATAEDVDSPSFWYSWFVDGIWKSAETVFTWIFDFLSAPAYHNVTLYVNDSEDATGHNYWNVWIDNTANQYWTVNYTIQTPGNGTNVTTAPINVSIEITPTPTSESEAVTIEHYSSTHFNTGSYTNTTYDDGVKLSYPELTGTYTSEVYDATENTSWDNFTWDGYSFVGGELNVQDNMVALWHTNNNWQDSTGGNDGTAYGQANFSTDSKYGSHSGNFDGNGDYALITDTGLPSANGARTVEAWIKTRNTVTSGEYRGILSYGTMSTGQYFGLAVDNHTLYFDSWGDGGTYSIRGTKVVDDGQWHHVAFTYNGTAARLYVNGTLDKESTITVNTVNTGTGRIGYYNWGSASFNGQIDELAAWNKTLTPEEIQQHYQGQTGTLKLQVRSCDDSLCDGEDYEGPTGVGSYYDSFGTFNLDLDNNQWFQYKAYLETNDANQTPKLHNVTVEGRTVADTPTINISSASVVFDGVTHNMSGTGLHWSWQSPTLDKGSHTFQAHAQDNYGNTNQTETRTVTVPSYNITFNVTSGEDGTQLDKTIKIICNYAGFNQLGDEYNPYGPYAFPVGNWQCEFGDDSKTYWNETVTFTVSGDDTIPVVMSLHGGLSFEEHNQLDWLYNCWKNGDCWDLLSKVNETTSKIWNKYLPTDESVVLQEINISSTLGPNQNITYSYTLHIPFKEGYGIGDPLPIRIFYWFTNADNECYSQDKQSDSNRAESPYCVPLIAEYLGPNGDNVTFTVDLRPDLPAGSYRVVRQIDIDPVENGEPVWITYGRNIIGTVKVLGGDSKTVAEEKEVVEPGHTTAKGIENVRNKITGGVIKNIAGQTSFILGLLVAFLVVSISANAYHTLSRKKR